VNWQHFMRFETQIVDDRSVKMEMIYRQEIREDDKAHI
jgi:hypothetical protein